MAVRASVTAFTHPGLQRDGNQDAVGAGAWFGEGTLWQPWRAQVEVDAPLLCVVADGMGGHAAGDVASADVVKHLQDHSASLASAAAVAGALETADRALHHRSRSEPRLAGMGTTVVGLVVTPARLIWFNVGDSRLYQYREGFLRQISRDDIPEGASHREGGARSHFVSASLGGAPGHGLDPHIGSEEVLPAKSRWLLCSDGVTDMLTRAEMEKAMVGSDLEAWAALFAGVMSKGAADNFSIVIVSVEARSEREIRHGA